VSEYNHPAELHGVPNRNPHELYQKMEISRSSNRNDVTVIEPWGSILEVAIWTPSPHNGQPWKVKIISESEAMLFIDKSRMLPKEDSTSSFLINGMTMFVEGIRIIAANFGFELDVVHKLPLQTDLNLIPFATLRLTKNLEAAKSYSNDLYAARRTSRLGYEDRSIPLEAINALREIAKANGYLVDVVSDSAEIEKLLSWNIDAVFDDFNDPNYHDEILQWMRFTEKESASRRDGLGVRCMGMSPLEYWLGSHWGFLFKLPIFRPLFKHLYRKRLGVIHHIGYISGPFWDQEAAVQSGVCLIRLWLEMQRLGVSMHPLGNLVTNGGAAGKCEGLFNQPNIWLVFKLGYSAPAPRSYRLTVQEILVA